MACVIKTTNYLLSLCYSVDLLHERPYISALYLRHLFFVRLQLLVNSRILLSSFFVIYCILIRSSGNNESRISNLVLGETDENFKSVNMKVCGEQAIISVSHTVSLQFLCNYML